MPANEQNNTVPPSKSGRQLRQFAVIVLALGLLSAGFVYWQGTNKPDLSDNIEMLGFDRAETRQMGQLFGKMGFMIEDLKDDLKRPSNQAIAIIAGAGIVAAACFYLARLLDIDASSE